MFCFCITSISDIIMSMFVRRVPDLFANFGHNTQRSFCGHLQTIQIQNAASDQGLHCLLTFVFEMNKRKTTTYLGLVLLIISGSPFKKNGLDSNQPHN